MPPPPTMNPEIMIRNNFLSKRKIYEELTDEKDIKKAKAEFFKFVKHILEMKVGIKDSEFVAGEIIEKNPIKSLLDFLEDHRIFETLAEKINMKI